jgi:hypothetical protein
VEFSPDGLMKEVVETRQKRCERFARACGSGDQSMSAGSNRRPGLDLDVRRLAEPRSKPVIDDGMEG